MRVWAARAVYGLALGGAVLFYCFYFGQLAWYVLMLAVCLPLFSLVVSLPAMLTAGIVLHAPAAVERDLCFTGIYAGMDACRAYGSTYFGGGPDASGPGLCAVASLARGGSCGMGAGHCALRGTAVQRAACVGI